MGPIKNAQNQYLSSKIIKKTLKWTKCIWEKNYIIIWTTQKKESNIIINDATKVSKFKKRIINSTITRIKKFTKKNFVS